MERQTRTLEYAGSNLSKKAQRFILQFTILRIDLPLLHMSLSVLTLQVFMFSGVGVNQPSLTLGHTLLPGSKPGYFCKPADVAVASSGTFYVADG